MRVLITGGSGFIGTNLVEHYLRLGVDVLNIDIAAPRNSSHSGVWKHQDILEEEALIEKVVEFQPEYCFHLAARTDLDGASVEDYQANTVGVRNIISAIKRCNSVKFVVFFSSMLVCRLGYNPTCDTDYCPSTPYGESKMEGERIVRDSASRLFPWTIVRPTSIWGPWFSTPYKDFFTAIQKGIYVHQKNTEVFRSYGFVLNTVHQLDVLSRVHGANCKGVAVYLSDYSPVELSSWANSIQASLGAKKIRVLPRCFFDVLAKIGDISKLLGVKNPALTSFRLSNMRTTMIHNTSPLETITGPLPFSVDQGVEITCHWITSCH